MPRIIVLHATAGKSDAGDLDWLMRPDLAKPVSYHSVCGRNGGLYSLVDYDRRAWHAGVANWKGISDVNAISVGLAWSNRHDGTEPLTPIQMAVMEGVVQYLAVKYPTIEDVLTHHDVAPQRKRDPNDCPGFDLSQYRDALRKARGGP